MRTFKQYLAEANNIILYRKIDDVKVVIEPDGSYTFWKDGGKTKGAQNRSLHGQDGAVKELMAIGYKPAQSLNEAVQPTQNEAWGFFGTSNAHNNYDQTKVFWDYASKELAKKLLWSPQKVREFLDSPGGRHFADSVADLGPWSFRHIDKAIQDWQSKDWFNSYK